MKTETREVTINKVIFIADDGKEFMDSQECKNYELDLIEKQLMCYDKDGNKVNDPADAIIVNLITDEDVKNYTRWSDTYEYDHEGIDKPGIYMYSCSDEWMNIEEVISKIRGAENDKT